MKPNKIFRSNQFWAIVIQASRIGIGSLTFIILSRELPLHQIGQAAAVLAFFSFFQGIINPAMSDFVVQHSDNEGTPSHQALRTASVTAFIGFLLFALLAIVPWGESLTSAKNQFWALSISAPFVALGSAYEGINRKRLNNRIIAIRTLIASSVSAILSIYALSKGLGGWALITFSIANPIISCIFLIITTPKETTPKGQSAHPSHAFAEFASMCGRYAFSAASVPLLQLSISSNLGAETGGIFQIAQRCYGIVDSIISWPLRYISLPLFAKSNLKQEQPRDRFLKLTKPALLIATPMYIGMAFTSQDLLVLALGQSKGSQASTFFEVLALSGPLALFVALGNQLLVAAGSIKIVVVRAGILFIVAICPAAYIATFNALAATWLFYWGGPTIGAALCIALLKSKAGINFAESWATIKAPLLAGALFLISCLILKRMTSDLEIHIRIIAWLAFFLIAATPYSILLKKTRR